MVNYSQRVEEKDGLKVYYFSFSKEDKDLVTRITNSDLKERLSAVSIAIAKDTHIRIKMPYWTDDNEFYMNFRLIANEEHKSMDYIYSAFGGIFGRIFGDHDERT